MYSVIKSKSGKTEVLYFYGLPVACKIEGSTFAVKYVDKHISKKVREWCETPPTLKDSGFFAKVALNVLISVL